MTSETSTTDPVLAGNGGAGPADAGPHADATAEARDGKSSRSRAISTALLAMAVIVPLALFTVRALNAPVNFDGGMNLQVAENLASGEGYMRFYHEPLDFPHEVQTNGPYIVVAAASILVFGENNFAFQLANLVFIAGLLVSVLALMRRESLGVRLVAPAVVLLAVPSIAIFGLGGLGEVPVTFFLFLAAWCLVRAVHTPERAPWWVLGASVAFGAAFTTKTFSIGALGALAAGVVCVLVAAPTRRLRLQVLLACAGAALLPVLREIHRLARLGSMDAYRTWWSDQGDSISSQSGLDSSGDQGLHQTFLDHMHVLSRLVDFPAELLLVVIFAPLVWAGTLLLWRWRRDGLRTTLSDPASVLLLIIAAFAASYILWWLLLLPEAKLWIRRIIPGLLSLHLLYLLWVPWLFRAGSDALRHRRERNGSTWARSLPVVGLAVVVAIIVVVPGNYARTKVEGNTRALIEGQEGWLDANRAAAGHIRANDDMRYYGDEWWSAPVVSLMSDTDFYNLGATDPCSLDPERDRLVWDYDAKNIRSQDPWTRDGKLVYEEVVSFRWFVAIYAVGPAPGLCD